MGRVGREGGREGGREVGREGGRERGSEGGRGGKEGVREGRREGETILQERERPLFKRERAYIIQYTRCSMFFKIQ